MGKYIYFLVGESGSGKTTIADELEKQFGLHSVCSYTTRPKRSEFESGHIFITENEFCRLTNICVYVEFSGDRYCATMEQIEKNDIYVIDPGGINYFKHHYQGSKKPKIIYIQVSEAERERRMLHRGDLKKNVADRLRHDEAHFANALLIADIVVGNDSLDQCVQDIYEYIKKE